ncbi:MAG: NAD(P)/FAD-dependent oxidoreductase [Arenicellales bacterium]|nr:NAD(P)/FAD-dependent oxidoreductase [Arenicellales bacterium]
MEFKTDVVIIGAGPSGLFQCFELGLLGIDAHIVDSLPVIGGQCSMLYPDKAIYDIPGLPIVGAQELIDRLAEQLKPFDPTFHLGHRVTRLTRLEDNSFELHTEGNICFQTRAVVIAAGLGAFKPRPLRLGGIDQFEQTNLHYHVADKLHFKDKKVVILGGGDSALDWVLELAVVSKHVHIVHRRDEFRAAPASIAKMHELIDDPNQPVDCLIGRIPSYQSDQGKITAIDVAPFGEGEPQRIELDELLVFYGLSPDLGPIADWGLDIERKHISVSLETFQTNIPGIYAIGDINTYPGKKKLILSGFHEGALAAFAIQQYLDPDTKHKLQYTTTSSALQKRLGVQNNAESTQG